MKNVIDAIIPAKASSVTIIDSIEKILSFLIISSVFQGKYSAVRHKLKNVVPTENINPKILKATCIISPTFQNHYIVIVY